MRTGIPRQLRTQSFLCMWRCLRPWLRVSRCNSCFWSWTSLPLPLFPSAVLIVGVECVTSTVRRKRPFDYAISTSAVPRATVHRRDESGAIAAVEMLPSLFVFVSQVFGDALRVGILDVSAMPHWHIEVDGIGWINSADFGQRFIQTGFKICRRIRLYDLYFWHFDVFHKKIHSFL